MADLSPTGRKDGTQLLRIAVGTKNPCKIDSVKKAINQLIKTDSQCNVEIHVEGFAVDSGVSDQPFGDEDTIQGAKTRAMKAYQAYREANKVFPHLSFGLEGGLEWSSLALDHEGNKTLWCMAWMAVYGKRKPLLVEVMASRESSCWLSDKKPVFSLAKTASFMLPSAMSDLIKKGMELGHADDKISGRKMSKQGSGTVGYLTDGMIDRSAYYQHALILALVPWIRPDVYSSKGSPNLT
mmetsp:Transcript_6993/g.14882  ORF Transcript_6993/g.14882 Transcript_6993/m.14882 type:complete len:239 (-) Transcript_6993:116-832(-)